MCAEQIDDIFNFTVLGIGDPGKYVVDKISASKDVMDSLNLHTWSRISDFRKENIKFNSTTKALFIILSSVEEDYFDFVLEIESFRNNTGAQVYIITNYPFLWEGNRRISIADACLLELIRFSFTVFRIESHQWFPLKEEFGFHKVLEMVYDAAAGTLLSIIELHTSNSDLKSLKSIPLDGEAMAIMRSAEYWTVERTD